jgi:hypothetical protein
MTTDEHAPICAQPATCLVCSITSPLPGESSAAMLARLGALYRAAPEAPRNRLGEKPVTERLCVVCGRAFLAYAATMCGGACRQARDRRRRGVPARRVAA